MKILTISHSDSLGGAARAAYRIHRALRSQSVESTMWVRHASLDDWTVSNPLKGMRRIASRLAPHIAQQLCRLHTTSNPILRSPAFIPSNLVEEINKSSADIVHLHWVGSEMLSVEAIGSISKPVVWTLHDMWAFCGAEHYAADERWRDGYFKDNRPEDDRGLDINRWVWRRKQKAWKRPFHIAAPSNWLAGAARKSALMTDWPICVIPNTMDTDAWSPVEKSHARDLMRITRERPLIAFGAWGVEQQHKGFDLLMSALRLLQRRMPDIQLLVIGQLAPEKPVDIEYPIHYAGHLHDDLSLRIAYSAADVMVVPSRIEAFGQTASEAMACGTPVVAFDVGGLPDIVEHELTGYLARPFDAGDLARGIEWVVEAVGLNDDLNVRARRSAVEKFSYPVVANKYRALYRDILRQA